MLRAWGKFSSSANVKDDCVGEIRPWSRLVTMNGCPAGIGKSLTVGVRRCALLGGEGGKGPLGGERSISRATIVKDDKEI